MDQSTSRGAAATRGLVAFSVGEFWFGARLEEVAGLIDAESVTALPVSGGGLEGVVAFRGAVVPALDLASYLGSTSWPGAATRYGVVLARGAERVALIVPSMPRFYPAREIQETEVTSEGDPEIDALLDSVYRAGETLVHCLHYWSIADAVMPTPGGDAAGSNR